MSEIALGIIDAQRGFMPAEEGKRLQVGGFGELPVTDGERIVDPVNRLLGGFTLYNLDIFTTQDWHPARTAHFSDNPDFRTSWPRHCVDGTAGAELHPEVGPLDTRTRFIKGFEPLEHGEDDTSYSGYFAVDPLTNLRLPEWLAKHEVNTVVLGGLALDYCVGKTAIDLRDKLGLGVVVALDASRGIAPDSVDQMLEAFAAKGIRTGSTESVLASLEA